MVYQKFVFQLFLLLIIITQICKCDVGRINCAMFEGGRKCTLSGLTLTSKNYTFVPVAPVSNAVIKFEFIQSSVHILTSNICSTFTKIKYFNAVDQHIEIVEDYAFNNCTDVTEINLEKNHIHKLGVGIFSNTKQLRKLHILGGSIDRIDVDLFSNLGELKQLLFSGNGLRELPMAAIKNLKKLELLYIYSNNLDDLNAKGIVDNMPNLKTIYLNDNNFHCDRLIEIIDIFKAKGIPTNDYTYLNSIKRRDYIPRKINNIMCLTQAQLDTEKLKKALTSSLDDLKDLPIGKAVIELKEIVSSGFEDSDSAIEALSYNFNETSDNLKEQIANLNVTLQKNLAVGNTDPVNELKNSTKELNEKIKKSLVVQQQLEQKLNENLAVQQRLEQKLEDAEKSDRKHDEAIASLMDKYIALDALLAATNASCSSLTMTNNKAVSNYTTEVWSCLAILLVIDVAMLAVVLSLIKKFRNVSSDVSIVLCHNELAHRGSLQPLQETFT